ncbi:hypothetical protein TWF281_003139 [Arthrobotrys megalospora]
MAAEGVSKPQTHHDYTVGWVCALSKERTAAIAMLDSINHVPLSQPPNDHNIYTLGSVGNHNVVVVCLPKGKYGTNAAAIAVAQMVNTFPSIKFALMVGIGGGIPPTVRLGDVVVSSPVDRFPGVFQWDLGKIEEGGKFKRTGSLNNPPRALLVALANLESEHEMKGSRIPKYLEELGDKWERLVPTYLKSDTLKDVLFAANSPHRSQSRWNAMFPNIWETILTFFAFLWNLWAFAPTERPVEQVTAATARAPVDEKQERDFGTDDIEENECRYCDTTKIIPRKPREMRIHYGLIASGNQVVKDAKFRDALNKELGGNVLCVEMESAGLMNDFPCIVIRGICDYADSHKNKSWQKHAAAVAAAFAKELLSVVPTQEVEQMPAIKSEEPPSYCFVFWGWSMGSPLML